MDDIHSDLSLCRINMLELSVKRILTSTQRPHMFPGRGWKKYLDAKMFYSSTCCSGFSNGKSWIQTFKKLNWYYYAVHLKCIQCYIWVKLKGKKKMLPRNFNRPLQLMYIWEPFLQNSNSSQTWQHIMSDQNNNNKTKILSRSPWQYKMLVALIRMSQIPFY